MIASDDQRTGRLHSAMLLVLLPNEILDVQFSALSGIERADALVDFNPELAQLFNVREQLAANLFLIGIGQVCYFGDGLFENLDHNNSIPHSVANARVMGACRKPSLAAIPHAPTRLRARHFLSAMVSSFHGEDELLRGELRRLLD
jgi:hypothetical protein